jgi:hypothetical protein
MNLGGDRHPETNGPAAAADQAGRGPVSRDVRETAGQVFWGVGKLLIIILAAFLGAAVVEAVRSIL